MSALKKRLIKKIIFVLVSVLILYLVLIFGYTTATYAQLVVPVETALEAKGVATVPSQLVEVEFVALEPKPIEPALLSQIAKCESNNNPKAKNASSTASGRFQFLKSTWDHYGKIYWGDELKNKNVFSYEDNTELAWWVFETYGTKDWDASRACWGKNLL